MKLTILLEETKKESIVSALRKCKPFLMQYKDDLMQGIFLLRGMKTEKTVSNISTQEKRKPRDSYQEFHDTVDDLLYRHLGHKFRSNKVCFCVASKPTSRHATRTLEEYGDTHLVFPTGSNYKFCYSTVVNDFYANYDYGIVGDLITTNSELCDYVVKHITMTLQNILREAGLDDAIIDKEKIETLASDLGDQMFRHYCGAYTHNNVIVDMYVELLSIENLDDKILNVIEEVCSISNLKSFVDGMFGYLNYSTHLNSLSDANEVTAAAGNGGSGQIEVMMNCDTYIAIKHSGTNKELIIESIKEILADET